MTSRVSYAPYGGDSVDLSRILGVLRESVVFYSVGRSMAADVEFPLGIGFLVIGIAGLWFVGRGSNQHPSWFRLIFLTGYALLPFALGSLASLVRPMIVSRHLMISAPAFCMVLALGVVGLSRRARPLGIAAGLFLVGAQVFSLGNYFFDYRYVKTDFPDAIHYVLDHTRPGDAVVLDGWGQPLQFWYY